MDTHLKSMLSRADELLRDLESEYNICLQDKNVTERAKNLTHEVLEKLRNALDHTMRKAWERYIAPELLQQDKERVIVYFPIAKDLGSFRSILGRASKGSVDRISKTLYDFLLSRQPFSSDQHQWLALLRSITVEGKHVQLTSQKRIEARRIKVTERSGGSVSWDPSSVRFGAGVRVVGAPVDPKTQRIVSTPGISQQVEIWVSFVMGDYGINALEFCKEAYQKTRELIEEMVTTLKLQDDPE